MPRYLKNTTAESVYYRGREFPTDVYVEIPNHLLDDFQNDSAVLSAIDSQDLVVSQNGESDFPGGAVAQKDFFNRNLKHYTSSFAVDLDNTDATFSGSGWQTVIANRVLWDFNEDYDAETGIFTVPADGIYDFDIQVRLKSMSLISEVELALFKVEEGADDYWFVLSKPPSALLTNGYQLQSATQFDFRAGEQYYVAIKLSGTLSFSVTLDGSDDYTAWGFTWSAPLIGG